ncbi:hypothetical protein ABIF69_004437 [Bradyrhizobium japonicum]
MRRTRTRLKRQTSGQGRQRERRFSAEEDEEGIEDWMVGGGDNLST